MPHPINFDYNTDDEPQRYGKEWWQDFWDRVRRYSRKPNEYKTSEWFIVRSHEEWELLNSGRWTWPKKEA